MKNKENSHYSLFLKGLILGLGLILMGGTAGWAKEAHTLKTLPLLKNLVETAQKRLKAGKKAGLRVNEQETDLIFEVKRNYFLIKAKNAQLAISREVKGHFEKAIQGAQEKFDEGEEDISQSAITKLKLGLTGTLNDILKFESGKGLARLDLQGLTGLTLAPDFKMEQTGFFPPDFSHNTVEEFLSHSGTNPKSKEISADVRMRLEREMIQIRRTRGAYELANQNRKMTRALLVTEVANYDFGIGNEGDLFEALMIYTALLVGYNEALYEFHLAVLNLEKVWVQVK